MRQVALILSATAALSLAIASGASAESCRDAKGKFIKCPAPATAPVSGKSQQCRDAKGAFTKCPAPATAQVSGKSQQCRDAKGAFVKCPAKSGTASSTAKSAAPAKSKS